MPYLMECHLTGTLYDVEEYEWDDLYCETCGDSDQEIGYYNTEEERQELINKLHDY